MEENIQTKKRKRNMKLYPIYEMLGIDFLFYYGIQVLFLSQVKGISDAQIVLAHSLYAFSAMFVAKVGKHKALIFGNIINVICMIIILICPNFIIYVIEEILNSVAFGIKAITEPSILENSIPKTKSKGKIFTKIHSKGYSRYCYISAFSMILSGVLYDINPYIPVLICLLFCAITVIISYNFYEIDNIEEKETFKEEANKLREGFKFIFASKRLKSLILVIGFIWGISCLFGTYKITILKELNCTATIIGIITAVYELVTGTISKKANYMNEKLKNKTLSSVMFSMTISFILIGIILFCNIAGNIKVSTIILLYFVIAGAHGICQVIQSRYLNNFADNKIVPLIHSANFIGRNLLRAIIGFLGALILSNFDIKYTMLITGVIFTIIAYAIYQYMQTRLGLKPEEYDEKDIKFIYK